MTKNNFTQIVKVQIIATNYDLQLVNQQIVAAPLYNTLGYQTKSRNL